VDGERGDVDGDLIACSSIYLKSWIWYVASLQDGRWMKKMYYSFYYR
jgi:hypothetical protein